MLDLIAAAFRDGNHKRHDGAGFWLKITTTTGAQHEVDIWADSAGSYRLTRLNTTAPLFFAPASVESVEVMF